MYGFPSLNSFQIPPLPHPPKSSHILTLFLIREQLGILKIIAQK